MKYTITLTKQNIEDIIRDHFFDNNITEVCPNVEAVYSGYGVGERKDMEFTGYTDVIEE